MPRQVQAAGRRVTLGVQVVQVPAQPVLQAGPHADEVLPVVDQLLQFPAGVSVFGAGQVGLPQRRSSDGQRVDGVGLAPGAGAGPVWAISFGGTRNTVTAASSNARSSRPETCRQSSTATSAFRPGN